MRGLGCVERRHVRRGQVVLGVERIALTHRVHPGESPEEPDCNCVQAIVCIQRQVVGYRPLSGAGVGLRGVDRTDSDTVYLKVDDSASRVTSVDQELAVLVEQGAAEGHTLAGYGRTGDGGNLQLGRCEDDDAGPRLISQQPGGAADSSEVGGNRHRAGGPVDVDINERVHAAIDVSGAP